MNWTIDLDNKLGLMAVEIDDEAIDDLLPPKPNS
jgi:hypothetical protein